jgi:uncharacterized protein involved in exopolysaccharide biosynthesis
MVDSTTNSVAQIAKLQGEIETLMARQKGLEAAVEATNVNEVQINDALEKLAACEPDLRGQEKELDTKTAAAARFTEAYDRYEVTKALDEAKFSNLRQIQEATLPTEKAGPNRQTFVLLGIVLGGAAGFLLAFIRAAFDRKMRGPGEIERRFGVRVLCTVPELVGLRKAVR